MRKRNLVGVVLGLLVLALVMGCGNVVQQSAVEGSTAEGSADLATERGVNDSWPVLRNGDSGRSVVTVQYLLRHRGYSLTVDGQFGPTTEYLVKHFQGTQGLYQDGVVGPNTWERLVVQVQYGSRGSAVRALQDQLRYGYGYSIGIDGIFGSATQSAVLDFKSKNWLGGAEVVGATTWLALIAGSSSGGSTVPTTRTGLAQRILQLHQQGKINLWTSQSTGYSSSPYKNIVDTANGGAAYRGSYKGGYVYLDTKMLTTMVQLVDTYGMTYEVSSLAGGGHGWNSYHYAGRAFDVSVVNGNRLNQYGTSANNYWGFINALQANGPVELLGPHYDPDGNHWHHIHAAY